jgi:HSP20 family protein
MTGSIRFNGVPHIRWNPAVLRGHAGSAALDVDRALQSLATEVFGAAATPAASATAGNPASNAATGELRADVRETATHYVMQLDVPGVAKEDITVDVDEKTVRIEATFERPVLAGETALLSERVDGTVKRNFRLQHAVEADQASAHHEHGVLTLTLPKRHAATQKRLAIN